MMVAGNLTVIEVSAKDGVPSVTSEEIARGFNLLVSRGLRPLWPPVHCPFNGRDRFMIAGVAPSPASALRGVREEPKASGGGFGW